MPSIRTLLVDDNPQFIEAAIRFLSSDPQVEVVGSALSGQAALEQVELLNPDLVLIDLAMPGMNGLEATQNIKLQSNAPQVIILTLYDNQEYRTACEAAHADGFVSKSDFGIKLIPIIQSLFKEEQVQNQVTA